MADAGRLPYGAFAELLENELHDDPIVAVAKKYDEMVTALVAKIKENAGRGHGSESFLEGMLVHTKLKGALFVGHVNTDLDSIAGAMAAADLYEGVAARAEEDFNGEIAYALKWTGLSAPEFFDRIPGGGKKDENGKYVNVCLVDHSEVDQMTPSLRKDKKRMNRIFGLIDHHTIAASFNPTRPMFIDTRDWGSMSTIVAHMYFRNRHVMSKEIARLLLCAILSDTLNLKSATTTQADRFCTAMLAKIGEVEDVNKVASELFAAKTSWIVGLGPYEMVRGDQKNFSINGVRLSIAVLEVTNPDLVLKHSEDILMHLTVFKYERGDYVNEDTEETKHDVDKECHCAMLFIVDTLKQCSVALICGGREEYLARKAFPEATWRPACKGVRSPSSFTSAAATLCDVGGLVSRKLEFLPMLTEAIKEGVPEWFCAGNTCKPFVSALLAASKPHHDSVRVKWELSQVKKAVFRPAERTPSEMPRLDRAISAPYHASKPKFTRVGKIGPDTTGINLLAKVVSRGENSKVDVVLGDSTGVITLLATPDQFDQCIPGKVMRVQNGRVKMLRTGAGAFVRLEVDKWGKVQEASVEESARIEGAEVSTRKNKTKDVSATEYELAKEEKSKQKR